MDLEFVAMGKNYSKHKRKEPEEPESAACFYPWVGVLHHSFERKT